MRSDKGEVEGRRDMPQLTYKKEITGLIVIDPYNVSFLRAARYGIA